MQIQQNNLLITLVEKQSPKSRYAQEQPRSVEQAELLSNIETANMLQNCSFSLPFNYIKKNIKSKGFGETTGTSRKMFFCFQCWVDK